MALICMTRKGPEVRILYGPPGTRRCSAAHIERLQRIGELTSAGVNLEGLRRVLGLEEELGCLSRELHRLAPSAGPDLRSVQRHLGGREDVKAFMQLPGSEQLPGR